MIPALIIPVFFYVVNIGQLEDLPDGSPASTSRRSSCPWPWPSPSPASARRRHSSPTSRTGYFDRLLLTPVKPTRAPARTDGRRRGARHHFDHARVGAGLPHRRPLRDRGPRHARLRGHLGALWGLAFTGFPVRDRVEDGEPRRRGGQLRPVLPVRVPHHDVPPAGVRSPDGWPPSPINPVTYVLETLRAIISDGWVAADILPGLLAIAGVAVVSIGLALITLRGRVERGS